MASTYTPSELEGQGTPLKENPNGGSTYTITITNKNLDGTGYLFMESTTPTATPPFSGSIWSGSGALGEVYDNYTQGINILKGGATEILWTPLNDIVGSQVYIKATGNIGATIDADGVSGPLFYYDPATSYSGTGTTLTDLSGNNRNALIAGSPAYTSGEGGYFTMANDYIRTVDLDALITVADESHTTEAWIYPTANGVIVSYQGETTPSAGYHFSAIELVSGQVEFGLWNGISITSTGGTGALTLNAWHQVVLTYDGTTCRGYIDGALAGSVAVNFDSPMNDASPVFMMYFGISDITNQGDGSYFDGRMGVIRVYNRALTSTEIEQNYEADRDIYGV